MPDLTTHFMFGEQLFDLLDPALAQLVSEYRTVYSVGTQGPDLLFFCKTKLGKSPLPRYASMLHRQKTTDILLFCKAYTASKQKTTEYPILAAYVTGFFSHYFLDRAMHPYVYYLTERRQGNGYSKNQHAVHAQIEAEIDSILYRLFHSGPVTEFRVKEHMRVEHGAKTVIAKFYVEMLREIFQVNAPIGEVIRCFDDFVQLSSLFYGTGKILPVAGRLLAKLYPDADIIPAHIKHQKISADTANFCENFWFHPKDHSKKSTKSVLALFKQSQQECAKALHDTFTSLDRPDYLPFEADINFHGNPCEEA